MAGYAVADLVHWNEKIEALVEMAGLDCYEQHFELCNYEDMLCYEAYAGMPAHYPHWSFGKAYERQKTFYQQNLCGLPYEMVINANPCLAYLMKDNTLLLQIMTMAHVYAHNDFFKNNRLFREQTRAELAVDMYKAHANQVREFLQDPSIGPACVERILDAAHALRFQTSRWGEGRPPGVKELAGESVREIPDRLKEDLLLFLAERGRLQDWERDLVYIVREQTLYLIPQIETKMINEGWATFWHYRLLKQMDLPQGLYLEFLQRHNMVAAPSPGRINPYHIGFKMFEALEKDGGMDLVMEARAQERDQSFIRRYLTRQLCEELHLFSYGTQQEDVIVTEVADEKGWQHIRDKLANSAGLAGMPIVRPASVEKGTLILEHIFDGREMDMQYTHETLKYVAELWGGKVELKTVLNGEAAVISCSEEKEINGQKKAQSGQDGGIARGIFGPKGVRRRCP